MIHQQSLLMTALGAAVPLEIDRLRSLPEAELRAIAARAVDEIAARGDVLQFGGKGCATTFAHLARGLAAAALTAEGGITWCGQHWCQRPGCSSVDAHLVERSGS